MLVQGFVQVGVLGYYYINKKMIAEQLCVNKANPNLHCQGKCYLSKQLKKAEQQEQKQSQNILKEKGEIFSQVVVVSEGNVVLPCTAHSLLTPYVFSYSSVLSLPDVQPPCAA